MIVLFMSINTQLRAYLSWLLHCHTIYLFKDIIHHHVRIINNSYSNWIPLYPGSVFKLFLQNTSYSLSVLWSSYISPVWSKSPINQWFVTVPSVSVDVKDGIYHHVLVIISAKMSEDWDISWYYPLCTILYLSQYLGCFHVPRECWLLTVHSQV